MSLLGEIKIPGPESDVPPSVSLLGEPGPESDVSLLGEFKKFKILGPQRDVSVLRQFKQFKIQNPGSQKVMFLCTGSSNSSNAVFLRSWRACHWLLLCVKWGFLGRVRGPPS